jgi:hypothetical protein
MANAVYPLYKQNQIQGVAGTALTGTLRAALVDLALYTYSAAHEFYTSVSAAVVGTPVELTGKTYVNGLFDATDTTLVAVTGDPCEAVVLFLDTGTPATSRLVGYFDTGVGGLPVTPNGGDVLLTWNASGIIQF